MKFPTAPRLPCLGLVLASAAGVLLADFFPVPDVWLITSLLVASAIALILLVRPSLAGTYLFVAVAFFLLHVLQTTSTPGQWLAARLGERPRIVRVNGAVTTEPKVSESGRATFLLELNSIELEGANVPTRATVMVRWRGQVQFGDEFSLFGVAAPLAGPRNPGEFDMRAYLARQDVYRVLTVRYPEDGKLLRHGGGNPILRAAQNARTRIQAVLCRDLEDSPEVQSLITGVTLGLRHQTADDIEEPFQQTGTLHLFAVAGLHVGIVAMLLWMMAKVLRVPQKWAGAVIIPLLLFYAAVTGLHVSSVRAAIMSSFLIGGYFFERKAMPLNSLAAAAFLLLLWDTNEIFSTGFQLSFAVVGTIILIAEPTARWFRRWTAPDPFLPRMLLRGRRKVIDRALIWLGQMTAVSLAAWVGSLILILWYLYLVTPVSLLANLAVVPVATFVIAGALVSILVAPISSWLSGVFNNANWFLSNVVIVLVGFFAQFPAGHYYLPHPEWPDGTRVQMEVLDLGPGGAAHVRTAQGHWLFDCGSERDYERVVRDYLHAKGVNRLHGILLTHGDSRHIGGVSRLMPELRPISLFDNPAPDRSAVHRRLRKLFTSLRAPVHDIVAGEVFELGDGTQAKVLFPPAGFSARSGDDQAEVVQLHIAPEATVLMMSDSGVETENALLASGFDLRSDILIKGQNHGSESGSARFIEAVHPQLVISTSQDFPEAERIKDPFVAMLRDHGIKLFRQDETGAVELRFRPKDWEARAYLTREVFRSNNR